jgi:hypothetical protein
VIAILETTEEETLFISDHNKGPRATDKELGDKILRAICVYYLKDNFTIKFSRTLKPLSGVLFARN